MCSSSIEITHPDLVLDLFVDAIYLGGEQKPPGEVLSKLFRVGNAGGFR